MRELCLFSRGETAVMERTVSEPTLESLNESARHEWYALSVKHQHERPIASNLQRRSFEALVPLYQARKRWSDRTKDMEVPLFPGYVFCRFPYDQRILVLNTPGISRIVGFGGRPAVIPLDEIAAIRRAMESKLPLRPWPHLKAGDHVRVEYGALKGVEGIVLREKDTRHKDGTVWLVLGIEMLQRSIAVEIEADSVTPTTRRLATALLSDGRHREHNPHLENDTHREYRLPGVVLGA